MLDGFRFHKAVKGKLKESNTTLTKEDITSTKDHLPPEALNSDNGKFSSLYTCEVWDNISQSVGSN